MKRAFYLLFFIFLFYQPVIFAKTSSLYPFKGEEDSYRFQLLTKEIRCVVCQNQTISDSNAPLANDLRDKVYRMILEKKSDDEIKNYLVKRYGEFILFKPRFNSSTFILWLFPLTSLIFALSFIFYYYKKTKNNDHTNNLVPYFGSSSHGSRNRD